MKFYHYSASTYHQLCQHVTDQKYFSILADEMSDISIVEQMVICFRTVNKNLHVEENAFSLYEMSFTNSKTLQNY